MAAVAHANSKGMYSWWWDSHISPKNSRWLQENLTDMDAKVKQMIKLLEEDADSFARRAEMYYKKRPELMKLVEEFYRAYRALAERYDHATGVIRHAHRTMAEAFPNQIPLIFADDAPAGVSAETGSRTPSHALFDHDELSKDAIGLSVKGNGEADPIAKRKGLKQLNDMFGLGEEENRARVRKGLNFQVAGERDQSQRKGKSRDLEAEVLSYSENGGKTEAEIMNLKKALAKLEAEREAGLLQYQQSLERLSNLESEVSYAEEDSKRLNERASSAEAAVQVLKKALSKLEAEKEASLLQYQRCLDKVSNLEESISVAQRDAGELDKRARNAESEVEALKQELARVEAEKEAALIQHKRCLEKISVLEERLKDAEEHVRRVNERADKGEAEVETLRQAMNKLSQEKETSLHQYQQCLENISSLELKLACAEEEAKRLNSEIDDGISKLKGAEEKCTLLERSNQTLHSELESMALKMGTQREELAEKQKELGNLWTCIQEERLRFVEAETAFQTLQHLHSQSQEELRSLATELQTGAQVLKEMENRSQGLEEEIHKVKEENRSLNELNLSSATTIKNLHSEISSLRETIGKLEAEVELRVDQRNALQQEIYCLKEELNDMNKKNQSMVEQVESIGFNPECFGLSVKTLQDEHTKLREKCEREEIEKSAILEKLKVLEKLREKNALLENSISDLNVELEGVREKLKELEVSYQSLLGENSTLISEKASLISQLQLTIENLEKMSEKNQLLENSLFDANAELEGLREKSKNIESSYQLLDNEKTGLITERETLVSQLNFTQQTLDDLGKRYVELNSTCMALEEERKSTLQKLEELQTSLDAEKEDRARASQLSESQLTSLKLQIHVLEEEVQSTKKEYEEELEKAVNADMEVFILHKCIQDLKGKILSLLIECQKLLESSQLSERLISRLENENLEQQQEVLSLQNQIKILRMGLYHVLATVLVDVNHKYEDNTQEDQNLLSCIISKIEDLQNSCANSWEENQQFAIEKLVLSTLLHELEMGATSLMTERNILNKEFWVQSEELCALQKEIQKFKKLNEELRLGLGEEDKKKEALIVVMQNLSQQLSEFKGAYQHSQEENSKLTEENRHLTKKVSDLMEDKCSMEEENCAIFGDKLSLINLSLIFKDVIAEKLKELGELTKNMENLQCLYDSTLEKMRMLEVRLEDSQMQNLHLKDSVEKLENELNSAKLVNEQLNTECDEVKMICDEKEKHILELAEVHDRQSKENRSLYESNENLEAELTKLHEEVEEAKVREERLCCELENGKDEVQMWQRHLEVVCADLQTSVVCEALFREKIRELTELCQNFEDADDVKAVEIDMLKEKINLLEGENQGTKAQLAAYIPAVVSLRDCVASLEKHTLWRRKVCKDDIEEVKHAKGAAHRQADCSIEISSDDQGAAVQDGLLGLQDIGSRIKDVEKAVLEMENLSALQVFTDNKELEAVMNQNEDLKCGRKQIAKEQKQVLQDGLSNDVNLQKPMPETSDTGNEVLTKDIMLDQMSECSSYGKSRRENMQVVDQILELWDTSDQDGSTDLTGGRDQNATSWTQPHRSEAVERHKRDCSSGSAVEKELRVDRLEISKSFGEPIQEGNMKKILERLDSDAQKLTNLQITVQDLKRKVDITEKSKKGKGYDFDSVKGKLEEAEERINKLFDVNRKLIKHIEASSTLTDEKPAVESDDGSRRKRVSDQARRCSEKIGRLQLEVQKLQFLLLKIVEENDRSGKAGIIGRDRRVLLRDYIYGGTRTSHKKKKASCCACMQPSTKEN